MAAFWTLSRVADALAGVIPSEGAPPRLGSPRPASDGFPQGDAPLTRVWTDTRTIQRGDCFVALTGERFDGHDFIAPAVAAGAAAVVVTDARRAVGAGVPVFEVPDTTRALGALGRYRRLSWGRPVVAVGGSNGKTSTKELIRAALGARLAVHATQGNLNNQVGVPMTLLALDDAADVAVIEVGTNLPGEIAILRDIVRPDIAVITAIEEEHLEGFGDLAGVLAEEASLLDGIVIAVVPGHDAALVGEARRRAVRVITAGIAGIADSEVSADRATLNADGTGSLTIGGVDMHVPLRGEHNMRNALLAIAVARACGISTDDAGRGIAALDPARMPGMRSSVEPLGGALLINDAYNANPGSARAALALLAAVAGPRPRVVILGTMRELGAQAARAHRDVAREAVGSGAALVAGIGEFGAALREVAVGDARVITAHDVDDLWPVLQRRLAPDAAILLKASRGVKLERIVPLLRKWAGAESPATSPDRTG
jgi:UDP-N-acetylmuramoyl-tripeptide--D-alanyl-D-alanine ligase